MVIPQYDSVIESDDKRYGAPGYNDPKKNIRKFFHRIIVP